MKRIFSMMIVALIALPAINTFAQNATVTLSGKVTSFEESLALEGVSVHVKGTEHYSGTQADGRFSISTAREDNVLVFKLQDYETLEVAVSDDKQYDIVLKRIDSNTSSPAKKTLREFTASTDDPGNMVKLKKS